MTSHLSSRSSWMSYQERFVNQVQNTPNRIAVVDQDQSWTYRQLHQQSDLLSQFLQVHQVQIDDLIVVLLPSSYAYIASSIAILKAGACFLPIPTDLPSSQIKAILEDACPKVVITASSFLDRLPSSSSHSYTAYLFDSPHALTQLTQTLDSKGLALNPLVPTQEHHLAFATYTSGTTGKPKGVLQIQKALVTSYESRYHYCPYQDRIASEETGMDQPEKVACNIFFMWEILRPLMYGASVYVIEDHLISVPKKLVQFLHHHQITEVLFTPSAFQRIIRSVSNDFLQTHLSHLRRVWLNGEVVTTQLVSEGRAALPAETRLLNTYSICECHDVSNSDLDQLNLDLIRQTAEGICPVGTAVDGVEIGVMTDEGLKPYGQGELYIGGQGLGRGYLHLEELTQARFPHVNQTRYYATGDLATVDQEGQITIKGRIGSMVKMRGYSVYLGAIEDALRKHPLIQDVHVFLRGEHLSQHLVAFLIASDSSTGRTSQEWIDPLTQTSPSLRTWLAEHVPAYMIPSKWVQVPHFPVHPISGKLDQKALWSLEKEEQSSLEMLAQAPQETFEACCHLMYQLWARSLELDLKSLSEESHFFNMGGHSLSAVDLMISIETVFNIEVEGDEIYQAPLFRDFVNVLFSPRFHLEDSRSLDPHTPHLNLDHSSPFWQKEDLELHFPSEQIWASSSRVSNLPITSTHLHSSQNQPQLSPHYIPLNQAKTLFITGATGYLGLGLLEAFLQHTDPTVKIYCLVRSKQSILGQLESGQSRLIHAYQRAEFGDLNPYIKSKRLQVIEGDITQPSLGLDSTLYETLSQHVDLIFHCAAMVNLQAPYSQTKPSIVEGTRHMIYFATHHTLKTFHHISTNSVFHFPTNDPYSEITSLEGKDRFLTDGYSQAKWVAESLVEHATQLGLPAVTYRPGNIGPHTQTALFNPNDLQTLIWKACFQSRSAPQNTDWFFEMTPVDHMSNLIVQIAQLASPKACYHLVHTRPLSADPLFKSWFEHQWIDTLYPTWQEWRQALLEQGKQTQNEMLLVLATSLKSFDLMLKDPHCYAIDHVEHDLPQYAQWLTVSSSLHPCFEKLQKA